MRDTLIVVHCYQGDAQLVADFMPEFQHHGQQVLLLSPADSPVEMPGISCRSAGERAYVRSTEDAPDEGRKMLERQEAHLRILLEYPQEFFLLHDADSVCLSPELPDYLFLYQDVLFYNGAETERFLPEHLHGEELQQMLKKFPSTYQPPVFFHRAVLERMLAASQDAMELCPPYAKLIDWYFACMPYVSGVNGVQLPGAISRPIWHQGDLDVVIPLVRDKGYVFVHSVKERQILNDLLFYRRMYLEQHSIEMYT